MTASSHISETEEARRRVAANPFWYHTMEVAPGVVTPGWFDQRPVLERMPWPDVRGKRCLDVGTADGFLAFELERRGASEVVATDIAGDELWDYPVHIRQRGMVFWDAVGAKKGEGFRIANELLRSEARRVEISAYDLAPDSVGTFDVVVCGALLLHLRDPIRALEAVRSVCIEHLLATNQVALRLTLARRWPLAVFEGTSDRAQWWLPNQLANRRMIEAAGFEVEASSGVYAVPFGPGHPARPGGALARMRRVGRRVLAGGDGVPHHAVLARPAL